MMLLAAVSCGRHADSDSPASRTVVVSPRHDGALREALLFSRDGDRILLKPGTYRLREPLELAGRKNIVIEPYRAGSRVVISGGIEIPFKNCGGVIDVSSLNLTAVMTKGFGHGTGPSWSEFFADGKPMRLSSWPDDRWVPMDSVVCQGKSVRYPENGSSYGIITFGDERPLSWKKPSNGFLFGCFRFGWSEEMVGIKRISGDHTLEVSDVTTYGFDSGESYQKWKVLNIPEEVDRPGEYALDPGDGKAYVCLPEGTTRLEVSLMGEPLLRIRDCGNVIVRGLEFSCSRADAIAISQSGDINVTDCEIHDMGHVAVTIDDPSRNCGLSGCRLYDLGAGAVELGGGDRMKLVRGDNYVENCSIHDYNRIEKSYRPAVQMNGIGNRISHCEIFNSSTQAILMYGNDQTIEYNDIHDVCLDVEDNGAIYYGRNPSQRGGVIRNNYFHDVIVPFNVRFVYHDDGSCACEVYGNVFSNISSPPVQIGGGSDIVYHDNVFMNLDCAAIKIDARLHTWGADRIPVMMDSLAKYDSPAFREHYPELEAYLANFRDPSRNVLTRNVFYNVKYAFEAVVWDDHDYNDIIDGTANWMTMSHNWKTTDNPGFLNPDNPKEGYADSPAVLQHIPGFVLPDIGGAGVKNLQLSE